MVVGRIRLCILFAIAVSLAASRAAAEDPVRFDWRGAYIGAHTGGALALVDVGDPFGPSVFGDTVRTPGALIGGQLGYNWQRGALVYGLEADLSSADLDGTNTCFAYSGLFISSNCAAHINAMGTVAGRLGWTLPWDDRTLVYGKAAPRSMRCRAAEAGYRASRTAAGVGAGCWVPAQSGRSCRDGPSKRNTRL
jgi:opacity protein-like surface antigen